MDQRKLDRERRRNQVFVTRNTEYHVRGGRVVAVRRRDNGDWLDEHDAIDLEVRGHLEGEMRLPLPGAPTPGQRLYLAGGQPGKDVITSTVDAIERPPKEIVLRRYPPEAA